jgi:hypothetical protein
VDVSLETSDHCRIFEVIQSGKSSSQVGLRRVVDFESIALEVPEEVSRTQSVGVDRRSVAAAEQLVPQVLVAWHWC